MRPPKASLAGDDSPFAFWNKTSSPTTYRILGNARRDPIIVQAFDDQFTDNSSNLLFGSLMLSSGQVSGWLTSHVLDTRTANGSALNTILWRGALAQILSWPPGTVLSHPSAASGDECGVSVSTGDVNGDGKADVIMGCDLDDVSLSGQGSAVVFLRKADNTGFEVGQVLTHPTPELNDYCGWSVTTGDVNGDGKADVVMGCILDNATTTDQGSAVVFLRKADNTGFEAGQVLAHPFPALSDQCGISVSTGDFNGDGKKDVAMGCNFDDISLSNQGSAVVFLRKADNTGFEAEP